VGRVVFGAGHPAVRFLLLDIADDAAGRLILTIFYPSAALAPEWLSLGAAVGVFFLFNWLPRQRDRASSCALAFPKACGSSIWL
jgi:NhaA family Na+:H+ antiporter